MRGLSFLAFVFLTMFCWGIYGPVLHEGQVYLGAPGQPSLFRAFIGVGVAYFLIAVLFPLLRIRHEKQGNWSPLGMAWSFSAGAIGAIGALGIIFAFKFGGSPVFVMPLVFGCAPVINTVVTMMIGKTIRQASMAFYLGVLVVAIGGAGVMFFKPQPGKIESGPNTMTRTEVAAVEYPAPGSAATSNQADETAGTRETDGLEMVPTSNPFLLMIGSIALTALCWGSYGPVLHKGQTKMAGSRLRPFLFVGLAYFVIAVAIPLAVQPMIQPEPGAWTISGTIWSLVAGAAGAVGALGIIYAFNFGGKPVFVMPLVFGGAPVVNTFSSILTKGGDITWPFYISLLLVICGAVTVLVCAPRSPAKK